MGVAGSRIQLVISTFMYISPLKSFQLQLLFVCILTVVGSSEDLMTGTFPLLETQYSFWKALLGRTLKKKALELLFLFLQTMVHRKHALYFQTTSQWQVQFQMHLTTA